MPYDRPLLTDLRRQAAADLAASLPGSDPLLRFSNLGILATILAGMANQHYGYLDWISREAVPFTATDEYLYAWGALKGVTLKPASKASGSTLFSNCTPTTAIPIGTPLVRGDGVTYTTTSGAVVDGSGNATVLATADVAAANGNCPVATVLTLGTSIPGIQSNSAVSVAFVGGADIETQDEFRSRMLQVYAQPPQGGAQSDYVTWALQVPGVTRAWCAPLGMGAGSVIVYFMEDDVRSAFGGFPQGTNGVATGESRAAPATGDQLVVANYIFPLRPVTALVYSCAPVASPTNFTISGTTDPTVRTNISNAIKEVFLRTGSPGGTVDLNTGAAGGIVNLLDIEAAIAAVPDSDGAVVTSPAANIVAATGYLSTLGVITWT